MNRAIATIDVGAIERNCARIVGDLDPGASLCAVVKAGGYGHGAVECARAAIRGGASYLAVATAAEAAELRAAFPDRLTLTMGALSESELDLALAAGSEIAVWSENFMRVVERRADAHGATARVHVKHDSGMGRLGESDPSVVEALCEAAVGLIELVGLWTHYATADEADSSYLSEQVRRFSEVVERVRAKREVPLVHASNSAAALGDVAPDLDMVRCGVAIYGLDPLQSDPAARALEPAIMLSSYVAAVKRFPAGTSAGYGRSWSAERDTWVAVLPIGYGDGYRRGLTNNAEVLIGGRRYPLVGTVSMDNVTVDLGSETDVGVGDEVVLIGAQDEERILCEELAERLGTINYEVVTGIAPRVPREYVGAGS
ncbi:alanine racemase [soil metagenome]